MFYQVVTRSLSECMQSPTTAKDFVSTIIGAANRKMHKTSKHLIGSSVGVGGGGGGGGKKSTATAATAACTSYVMNSRSEDVPDSMVAAVPVSIFLLTRVQIVAVRKLVKLIFSGSLARRVYQS